MMRSREHTHLAGRPWFLPLCVAAMAALLIALPESGVVAPAAVALALWPASRGMVLSCGLLVVTYCALLPYVMESVLATGVSPVAIPLVLCGIAAAYHAFRRTLLDDEARARLRRASLLTPARLRSLLGILAFLLVFMMILRSVSILAHGSAALVVMLVRVHLPRPGIAFKKQLQRAGMNGTVLAVSSLLAVALVEFGARTLIYPDGIPGGVYVYHPGAFVTLRPNGVGGNWVPISPYDKQFVPVRISSQGLRDIYHGPKRAGETRIALLGDSFTYGATTTLEDTIGRQLSELLGARDNPGPVSVINLGVGGTAPWQHRIFLEERGFPLEPDIVIHQLFLGNDLAGALERSGQRLEAFHERWEENLLEWHRYDLPQFRYDAALAGHSAAYAALRSTVGEDDMHSFLASGLRIFPEYDKGDLPENASRPSRMEPDLAQWYPLLDEAWRRTLADLAEIAALCRERGIRYAVYAVPYFEELSDDVWTRRAENRPDGVRYERGKSRRLLAEALEERGIMHFSVAEALKDAPRLDAAYYRFDGHLTPLGNRIVAEAIRDFLLDQSWLAEANKLSENANEAASAQRASVRQVSRR